MRAKSPARLILFLLALILAVLAGCGATNEARLGQGLTANDNRADGGQKPGGREVPLGESFKLEKDERVSVRDTKLALQLKTVRRSWLANGKGEIVDAEILITLDGREQTEWMKLGALVTVGDYTIKLLGAYPFGKTNAELVVTRR